MRGRGDGFYKRGGVWWCRLGGKRVSTGCKDRQAAELWRRDQERRAADPSYAAASETTVASGVRAFLADRRERKKSAATVAFYEQKLGHVARIFGADEPLSVVTAESVDAYISKRRSEDASESTIAKELTALRGLLKLMRRRERYHREPSAVLPIGFSPEYTPRKRVLTPGELAALCLQLGPERAAYVRFVVATGARRSELFRAEVGDVDLVGGLVRLRGSKTKKADRTVPMLPLYRPLLEQVLRDAPRAAGGRLFPAWGNARRDVLRACERAKVDAVTWNDLRRTHASWLRARGVEPSLLAELLGHTSSRMAELVYGRVTPEQLGHLVAARLDAYQPPAPPAEPAKKASR